MSYIRAEEILPEEVLASIQQYVEGQMIYIPKKVRQQEKMGDRNRHQKKIWRFVMHACMRCIVKARL